MHHKQDGRQQLVHALPIAEARVLSDVAEENILHRLSEAERITGDVIANVGGACLTGCVPA